MGGGQMVKEDEQVKEDEDADDQLGLQGVGSLALCTRVVGLAVGIRWPRIRICLKAAALPVEGAKSKGGATKAWGRAARPAWCALLGVDRGGGQPPVVHLERQRRERLAPHGACQGASGAVDVGARCTQPLA